MTNHDGTMLVDELGPVPDGIGVASSASRSRMYVIPVRTMVALLAIYAVGFVISAVLISVRRDTVAVAGSIVLAGAPLAILIVMGFISLLGYRARTFVGGDGIALVRGRRCRVIAFADLGELTSKIKSSDRYGDRLVVRARDRDGRTVLYAYADVDERERRPVEPGTLVAGPAGRIIGLPTSSSAHFLVRSVEAWQGVHAR